MLYQQIFFLSISYCHMVRLSYNIHEYNGRPPQLSCKSGFIGNTVLVNFQPTGVFTVLYLRTGSVSIPEMLEI